LFWPHQQARHTAEAQIAGCSINDVNTLSAESLLVTTTTTTATTVDAQSGGKGIISQRTYVGGFFQQQQQQDQHKERLRPHETLWTQERNLTTHIVVICIQDAFHSAHSVPQEYVC
jgi:hypothetical protein